MDWYIILYTNFKRFIIMIYHEKADIKTYKRKTKNEVKEFNQINLGYESEFKKGEDIVVLKLSDFNDILVKIEKYNDMDENIKNLENTVNKLEKDKDYLTIENKNLNEDLKAELDLRSKLIFSYERVISDIQDKWLYRLLNMKLPDSYKLLDEFKEDKKE